MFVLHSHLHLQKILLTSLLFAGDDIPGQLLSISVGAVGIQDVFIEAGWGFFGGQL